MKINFKGDILEVYLTESVSININLKEQITIDGITQINIWLEDGYENLYWLSGAIDENGNEIIPLSIRLLDEFDDKDKPDIVLYPGKKAVIRKVNGHDYLISLKNQSFSIINGRPVPKEYILKTNFIKKEDNGLICCAMDINTFFLYDVINNKKMTPDVNGLRLILNKNGKIEYELIIKGEERDYYKEFLVLLYYDATTSSIDSNAEVIFTSPLYFRVGVILPGNVKTRKQISDYCNNCIDNSIESHYSDESKGGIYLN